MPVSFLRRALPSVLLFVLASGADAADSAAKCRYVNVGELPVRYLSPSFHPAIEGAINGKPASMLLDTGAHATYLTRKAAERLELSMRMTGSTVSGIGGLSRVYSTRVSDFSVGPAHGPLASMRVIGDTSGEMGYDAIVGADFLLQTDMEIALADKRVRFFRAQDCGDRFLAYWSEDAIVLPFAGGFGNSHNPVFEVELNGKKMFAAIDSGASRSVVTARAARQAGVDTNAPGTAKGRGMAGVGAERTATWHAVFDSLAIGPEVIRYADIDIIDSAPGERIPADILLGADFLRAHRVLFAMGQQRVYLSWLGGDVFTRGYKGIEPWLQREVDAGNPEAQMLVAAKYLSGSGVDRDTVLGMSLLTKAAVQGHPLARKALEKRKAGAAPPAAN
jgi:predicted aspartyl protease